MFCNLHHLLHLFFRELLAHTPFVLDTDVVVNIVSTSPSIWPIFYIFSLAQDLGFLEFQDRNLLLDFHSPDDKMPRLCGLTLRRTINDGADNHDDVFKGRFTSAVVKSLQMM